MMTADNGVVTEWQSYLGNLAMVKGGGLEKYWTDSEVYRCKGGNQQLATKLVAAIGAPRVLTRTPVALGRRHRSRRARHARQRQGARGRPRDPDRAAVGLEPDRVRSGAAADARAADGHQREVPDRRCKGPFWRRAELAPDLLSDGPVNMTWHAHRRTARARARRSSRSPADRRPSSAASGAPRRDRELPRRARQGLHGHPRRATCARRGSWTGRAMPGSRRRTRSRRRARSPRRARRCYDGHRPPALRRRVLELRVHGLHGRRAALGRGGRAPDRRRATAS